VGGASYHPLFITAKAAQLKLPQVTAYLPALEFIETGSISINLRVNWKISI
jgi:hypothetical protein